MAANGKLEGRIDRTLCQFCGAIVLVPGFDTCDRCLVDEVHFIPIADIADVLVMMDRIGLSKQDRGEYFKRYRVTPMQWAAAEEEADARYKAAGWKRNRYRGWNG